MISEEFKWLYRELWIWRAFALLIISAMVAVEAYKITQQTDHYSSTEISVAKTLQEGERQRAMITKNWEQMIRTDEHVRQLNEEQIRNQTDIKVATDRILRQANTNERLILALDERMRQCASCHIKTPPQVK